MASEAKYVNPGTKLSLNTHSLQQQTGINQPLRLTVPVQPYPVCPLSLSFNVLTSFS